MSNFVIFGLLHIKIKENNKLNFVHRNDEEKIYVYLKNAVLLSEQLRAQNVNFVLITNKKKLLQKYLDRLNYKINLKEIKFHTFVPKNTHFYSCHYRVDVFRYLSNLKNNYSILVDLDVLIFGNLKKFFKKKNNRIAYVHDITNNVIPAYGESSILSNLKKLNPSINSVKWYGGDFFAGNYMFYKKLFQKTKRYQKLFIKYPSFIKNQTDELFISAAINDMNFYKINKINNSAQKKIFTRYWNTNVRHKQKNLSYYQKFYILHLPSDKIFLNTFLKKLPLKNNFKYEYFNYVKSLKNLFKINVLRFLPIYLKNQIKRVAH